MSKLCAVLIVIAILSIPVLLVTLLIRALRKKSIKKLLIGLVICVGSILPLTLLGTFTDPATWCEHEYEVLEEVAPTCTNKGIVVKKCNLCERDEVEHPDILPHSWVEDSVVSATCESEGYTIEKCTSCSTTQKTHTTNALGHSLKDVSRIEPTTSAEGEIVSRCERCDYEETEVLSKLNASIVNRNATLPISD